MSTFAKRPRIFSTISVLVFLLMCGCTVHYPERTIPFIMQVTQPFLELHSENNNSSPVFYVIEQNQYFSVLGYNEGFFIIKAEAGHKGWVSEEEIRKTVSPYGKAVSKIEYGLIKLEQ